MSETVTIDGSYGEGGGQVLAHELDVPLLGKVPLQESLRVGADTGEPLVVTDPDAPASQAIFHAARGLIAVTPQGTDRAGKPVRFQGYVFRSNVPFTAPLVVPSCAGGAPTGTVGVTSRSTPSRTSAAVVENPNFVLMRVIPTSPFSVSRKDSGAVLYGVVVEYGT